MSKFDINKVAKAVQKEFGTAHVAGSKEDSKDIISTRNKALDLCLNGGINIGHACEFSGLSGTGKTTLLQILLADMQKKYDAVGVWLDRENAFFNDRATQLGVDINNVIIAKPGDIPTVPDATRFLKKSLESIYEEDPDKYVFIAIDSLSAFASTVDIGKEDMGKVAKHIHAMFRNALPTIHAKVFVGFVVHITYKTGIVFGETKTTAGGEAPKYYATYRIQLSDKKSIIDVNKGNRELGTWIEAEVIKTRRGAGGLVAHIPLLYKEGLPYYGGYVRLLVKENYLKAKNKNEFQGFKQKTVVHPDGTLFVEDNVEDLLKKHPELDFKEYPKYNIE